MNDFSKGGFYVNLFGDFMALVHNVLNAPESEQKLTFYRAMSGFYMKYPTSYASAILLAFDHELVRKPYVMMLTEEQYKGFLKEYYVMLKDILGVKLYQMSEDDLCSYALCQMDSLQKKYNVYSGTSVAWQFGFEMLEAAVDEVDRVVLEIAVNRVAIA